MDRTFREIREVSCHALVNGYNCTMEMTGQIALESPVICAKEDKEANKKAMFTISDQEEIRCSVCFSLLKMKVDSIYEFNLHWYLQRFIEAGEPSGEVASVSGGTPERTPKAETLMVKTGIIFQCIYFRRRGRTQKIFRKNSEKINFT